jgi:hypothetical protein
MHMALNLILAILKNIYCSSMSLQLNLVQDKLLWYTINIKQNTLSKF